MRIFIVIATISCILAKDIYQFGWDVWFTLNQKEIAREHCENKEKPILKCNGKCYLAKQLKKAEVESSDGNSKSDKNSRPIIPKENQIEEFKRVNAYFEFDFNEMNEKSEFISNEPIWNYRHFSEIDRPPTI